MLTGFARFEIVTLQGRKGKRMAKHYHYHVTYMQGRRRLTDTLSHTTKVGAEIALKYFRIGERPRIKRVDASCTCASLARAVADFRCNANRNRIETLGLQGKGGQEND